MHRSVHRYRGIHEFTSPADGRRRIIGMVAAFALVLGGAIFAAPFASAGTTPPFTIGPNPSAIVPAPDLDEVADAAEDPEGNVKELGPLNQSTTKIGVIHNDAVPTLGFTNPNGQVDLRRAWVTSEKDGDGDDWVYFAWERDNESGSGFIAYEFMRADAPAVCDDYDPTDTAIVNGCNPWANRDGDSDGAGPDVGDFMVLWDQQGGSRDLYFRKWVGTAPNLTLTASVLLTSDVAVAAYGHGGFRGEAAINITDVVFGGTASCLAFANIIPSTVTGNSDTADYKDTILEPGLDLSNCETTTTTTPKDGAGATIPAGGLALGTDGVAEVKDSALITIAGGAGVPAGTIDFTLCEANTAASAACDAGGKSVLVGNDVAVSDADNAFPVTVSSPSAWVTAAGRYCWKAVYTGNPAAGYSGSSDVSVGECFVVNPVTPTLTTTAGADVTLGSAVSDSATLTGTAPKPTANVIETTAPTPASRTAATGTITFTLFGPATGSCGSLVATRTATVSGDSPPDYGPVTATPTAAGDYHWKASYDGDSPNTNGTSHNTNCTETGEDVTVTTVTPTLGTAQTWVPDDSATITAAAGGDLTGTVSFALYGSTDCTGAVLFSQNVAIPANAGLSETVGTTNDGTGPDGYTAAAGGDFSWSVSYDSTNPAQNDLAATCHEVSSLTLDNDNTN